MKKYLLCLVGAIAFSTASIAADIPVKAPAQPDQQQLFNWSGWHISLSGGYSWSSVRNSAFGGSVTSSPDGGHLALGLGYDTVVSGQLIGIEGDIGLLSGSGSAIGGLVTNEGSYIATLRGRYGVPVYPNLLLFGTAGAALVGNKFSVLGISDHKTHLTYVVGAGLETKIKDRLRARAEYLYVGADKENYSVLGTTVTGKVEHHITRIGIIQDF